MATHNPAQIEAEIRQQAPDLHEESLQLLVMMYAATELPGQDGRMMELGQTKVTIAQGAMMNRLIRQTKAKLSLEIGFAYGFSTIWMLDAIAANGGQHVALDPFERTAWNGVGLKNVAAHSIGKSRFEWVEDFSIHALTAAIRRKKLYDFIFIDGNHRYDDVLVDFYLADQALQQNGLMAFDDMWMPAVRTAVDFVATNRSYRLIDQPVFNLSAFQKVRMDDRNWDHFVPFSVHEGVKYSR